MISPQENVSPFDVNMACDAGYDVVIPYTSVNLTDVKGLVQDAIFSRSPSDAKKTGIFICGKDASLALDMMDTAKKSMVPPFEISVFPDPAGKARKTSSTTTDHKILYNAGFNVQVKRSHPAVKDRINSVNSAFASNKLLIDPSCKSLRNCLNKLSYREGSNEQDKQSGLDHMPDALGYMVEYLYPIQRVTTPRVEPARWAVNAPPVRRFG